MNIAKYCKEKGMTKGEFINFKNNIKTTAEAIRNTLHYNGGVYYETNTLFHWNTNKDMKHFIIQELKQLGIEFFDNNEYYRVTD